MILLTQDLDFSKLIALEGQNSPSLVTLRLSISNPGATTGKLLEALPGIEAVLREGFAVTIGDGGTRARKLPIK